MSDPDKGDPDKSFLARWSQRKQEAKQPEPKPDAPAVESDALAKPVAEAEVAPEFDLASLPKLEELTATTDITAFLQKGVPEHLRNAALRKSWALDPAIRNYVNPALEYAYDWNTPGGVPGSGELGAGLDVARMVSQIMGGETPPEPSNPVGDPRIERENSSGESVDAGPSAQELSAQSLRLGSEADLSQGDKPGTGQTVKSEAVDTVAPQQPVRRHGSAKPVV